MDESHVGTLFKRAASFTKARSEIEAKRNLFALQVSDGGRVATETLDWVLSVFDKHVDAAEERPYDKYETWEEYEEERKAEEGFSRKISSEGVVRENSGAAREAAAWQIRETEKAPSEEETAENKAYNGPTASTGSEEKSSG